MVSFFPSKIINVLLSQYKGLVTMVLKLVLAKIGFG